MISALVILIVFAMGIALGVVITKLYNNRKIKEVTAHNERFLDNYLIK